MRTATSRLFRFLCWLWYAHDGDCCGHVTSRVCGRCGAQQHKMFAGWQEEPVAKVPVERTGKT